MQSLLWLWIQCPFLLLVVPDLPFLEALELPPGSLFGFESLKEYILSFCCSLLQLHFPYFAFRLVVLDYVFLPHGVFVVPFLEAQEPTPGSLVCSCGRRKLAQRCCFPLCVSTDALCTLHCALCTVQCQLCNVHCALCTAAPPEWCSTLLQ